MQASAAKPRLRRAHACVKALQVAAARAERTVRRCERRGGRQWPNAGTSSTHIHEPTLRTQPQRKARNNGPATRREKYIRKAQTPVHGDMKQWKEDW
eukprot:3533817-Pleurochrysis_carterae.AAC.2